MSMTELKPCPFCGGKARIMLEDEHLPDECFHNIYCTSCGAQFWVKSKTEAITVWNRRIERGELREVVYCYECSYAKETAVIICKNTDSPFRGSFLKGHDHCSFGRRKSDESISH